MIAVAPFLVDHPEHGRLVVLGLVSRGSQTLAIVAGDGVGTLPIEQLTVVKPGRDWPAGWEPPSTEEP